MRALQDKDDLVVHLREQLQFLEASAYSYDAGFEAEAKRLAVGLRILLHDAPKAHSLLSALGIKQSLKFHDVIGPGVEEPGV